MLRRACLAFWMLPRSGFLFLRNTSSCCCPAQRPRTHSLFTCDTITTFSLTDSQIEGSSLNGSNWSHLDDAEAEVSTIEHDDLVLVRAFVQYMAKGEEGGSIGQHSTPPGRVALMSDDQVLLVGGDGLIENRRLIILIRGRKVVLKRKKNQKNEASENEMVFN